ncbi:DUF6188 family protein [Streptomyces sp. R35]|uniref:DUF6188 family protein n=1 Tax=Streptomyces sp. R35 TaxID=3238630 RepID=A0AB39SHY2_9ACTN
MALVGTRVIRIAFDYQVHLLLSSTGEGGRGVEAELILETPFLFRDSTGQEHELEPGKGVCLAPVLGLFGQTLATVGVQGLGTLTIDFQNGAGLRIAPDPQFESWHLLGSGIDAVTVGPGGERAWES